MTPSSVTNNLPFVLVGVLPLTSPPLIKTTPPLLCRPSDPKTTRSPLCLNYLPNPLLKQPAFPLYVPIPLLFMRKPFFSPCETQGGPCGRPRSVTPSSTNGPREFPFVFVFATWHGMAPSRRTPLCSGKALVVLTSRKPRLLGQSPNRPALGAYAPRLGRLGNVRCMVVR